MLVAAALVPQTALMVPGAGGSATVLADARAAALTTLADVVATDPDRVVVVVAAAVDGSEVLPPGQGRPTLAAAGIPDTALPWLSAGAPDGEPADQGPDAAVTAVTDVAASVALLLLRRAGWDGDVSVRLVGGSQAGALARAGEQLAGEGGRVALVLCASLSARRGPDAPLPDDERAEAVDEAVVADLAALGEGSPASVAAAQRLAAVPPDLAVELAISAWAPWQVLLGALAVGPRDRPALRGEVRWVGTPFGATAVVAGWGLRQR